jgi:hypothetical protein
MDKSKRAGLAAIWAIGLLLLVSLACAQAGEILSPEEATARAQPTKRPTRPPATAASTQEGAPQVGDTVRLTSQGFLVNILVEPGGRIIANQERGAEVTILEETQHEGETWYLIDAPTGEGWVQAEFLEVKEGASTESGGPQVGDEVYLTATTFLINILVEPDGRIIANQERGAAVTILDVTEEEGETWYLIDAPTGEGWVKAENITTEEP